MTTLYTNGDFVSLSPSQFNSYSLIRHSIGQPSLFVLLGFTVSGTVNFSGKLGLVSAEIDGWTGNDNITSGSGNDSLWGNGGNDFLYGGVGDDLLVGDWDQGVATGNDQLFGGDGNDLLAGGTGSNALYGGNGDDTFYLAEPVSGTNAFYGGAGVDALMIADFLGNGTFAFAVSKLSLTAASAVEYLVIDGTMLSLTGTAGNDAINLSGVQALTNTGGGNYGAFVFINLLGGTDSYVGSADADYVSASGGNDNLSLGDGDDVLTLTDGSRTGSALFGGSGSDTLVLGDVNYHGTAALHVYTITSFSFMTTGLFESLLVAGDVQLTFGQSADVVNLSGFSVLGMRQPLLLLGGNDSFTSGATDGWVDGGAGDDTLLGGLGDDTLMGGIGNDSMVGGEGSDTYEITSAADVVVETGITGADTLVVTLRKWSLLGPFENLTAAGLSGLTGFGTNGANVMTGGAGTDSLTGYAGNDTLLGASHDTLLGGRGDDTYFVSASDVKIVELVKGGTDRVEAFSATFVLPAFVENLTMHGPGDGVTVNLSGTGNAMNNLIVGDYGRDTLIGLDGNDTLEGGDNFDSLFGGAGDDTYRLTAIRASAGNLIYDVVVEGIGGGTDTAEVSAEEFSIAGMANVENLYDAYQGASRVFGNAGNNALITQGGDDYLDGGAGHDRLTGGAGADKFVFQGPIGSSFAIASSDRITDFTQGLDHIVLFSWSFSFLSGGSTLTDNDFKVISGGGVQDQSDCILYNQDTGELFYDNDRLGSNAPQLFAVLENHTTLTVSDFEIVF